MRAYAYVFAGLAALSLAACGGGGGWQKQGASAEQRSQDLAECQADARSVLQRDTAIDADILRRGATTGRRATRSPPARRACARPTAAAPKRSSAAA
jgi:hypothetical protein